MRVTRIYITDSADVGAELELPRGPSEHLLRVLRLQSGALVCLFDGLGNEYQAQLLVTAGSKQARVRIIDKQFVDRESPLDITLAQGIARGERMDLIIQKAVELGVRRVVPLQTERSEVRLKGDRLEKRLAHWQAVIVAACEQSARNTLPQLEPVQDLGRWLDKEPATGLRLTLSPQANDGLPQLAKGATQVTLVVGPEGGLGERDLALLHNAGFVGARMGPRILRTETAGLAALAVLQALAGDLG